MHNIKEKDNGVLEIQILSVNKYRLYEGCGKDCKVIPGETLTSQHRLTILDIHIKGQCCTRKDPINLRTRWWNLKGEKLVIFQERMYTEAPWNLEDGSNTMWDRIAGCITRISKEVLGESKGRRLASKDTWWWNEEVQAVVKTKKD